MNVPVWAAFLVDQVLVNQVLSIWASCGSKKAPSLDFASLDFEGPAARGLDSNNRNAKAPGGDAK
jgi:hypothetical protein